MELRLFLNKQAEFWTSSVLFVKPDGAFERKLDER